MFLALAGFEEGIHENGICMWPILLQDGRTRWFFWHVPRADFTQYEALLYVQKHMKKHVEVVDS